MRTATETELKAIERRKAFHDKIASQAALLRPSKPESVAAPSEVDCSGIIERLRDRLAELESLLGVGNDDISRLRALLRLKPQACLIVGFLLGRAVATREALFTLVFGARPECDQPDIKIIDVQMVHVRAALKKHGIAVRIEWGIGSWSLSPADKAKLRSLMAAVDAPVSSPAARRARRYLVQA